MGESSTAGNSASRVVPATTLARRPAPAAKGGFWRTMMGRLREAENGHGATAFWLRAVERLGLPTLFVGALLYLMGWKFPEIGQRWVDAITTSIDRSAVAQIEFARAAEVRAEERTRQAVLRLETEVRKGGGK